MIDIIYSKEYLDLINKARERGWTKKAANKQGIYVEGHHIIPKCIAPELEKDEDNIVFLTAREHYEAHRFLSESNPDINGLIAAWWNMCQRNKSKEVITAEEYEAARIVNAKRASETQMGELNHAYGKPGNMLGKKHSLESNKKLSESRKLFIKENPDFQSGSKNHMYGKHGSEHHSSKQVYDWNSNKTWENAIECSKELGCSSDMIRSVCRGRKHFGKKYSQYDLHYYPKEENK